LSMCGIQITKRSNNLPLAYFPCLPALTLLKRLADTKNRLQSARKRLTNLLSHQGIGFSQQRTALRVPHDDIAAPNILKHRRGQLTGICTFWERRHILRPQSNSRSSQHLTRLSHVQRGRTNHDIDTSGKILLCSPERADQLLDKLGISVGLPVSCN